MRGSWGPGVVEYFHGAEPRMMFRVSRARAYASFVGLSRRMAMAGRPKMMAKRVTELEAEALDFSFRVCSACPDQYHKPSDDPLCEAWGVAVSGAIGASRELQRLGDILRKKAGITEPGPVQQFDEEILALKSEYAVGQPPESESPLPLATPTTG